MKSQGCMKPTDGAWCAASQNARQHRIGDRIGQKLSAHVAAVENAFVDGIALGLRKFGSV